MSEAQKNNLEFDPIKYEVGGKTSEQIIWTTAALEKAVEGINKGLPLKANPFMGKDTQLLKPNLVRKYTQDEINDIIHCMKDPIYFGSKCHIMTPEGLQQCKLREYQEDYIRLLQNNRFSILKACRQAGKCVSMLSTIIVRTEKNVEVIPLFKLYNRYCKQTKLWKLKYYIYERLFKKYDAVLEKILSLLDYIDFKFYHNTLLDTIKVIDEIPLTNVYVYTDTGYHRINEIMITRPFDQYVLTLEGGYTLSCADTHIVYNEKAQEVYVKDLQIGDYVYTDSGLRKIVEMHTNNNKVCMCDISVNSADHRFFCNGILSHNSVTTAIYCLWVILFNYDKMGLILSKSGPAGVDLIRKIKDMYRFLPYHLKIGTMKWNQAEISFDNNSMISTEAFSPTAGLGKTINFLILDEFAWCPPNDVELFYNNIIPTVTTISDSNVCIMSTQNGFNLFYKLWKGAVEKTNIYAPFNIDWYQVPQYNVKTKQWEKRDANWKKMMVGILGSEEAFQYQYGTQFAASDHCLVSREALSTIHDRVNLFEVNEGLEIVLNHKDCLKWKKDFDIESLRTGYFVVLADLAEGIKSDYTVFHIFQLLLNEDSKSENDKFIWDEVGYWRSNEIDIEGSAFDFWLLVCQLFNNDRSLVSIEWNTYGALFYNIISNLNEPEYDKNSNWRFNIAPYGFDTDIIVTYKKTNTIEDNVLNTGGHSNRKFIPGIRFTPGNKGISCSLLKMLIEKDIVRINDLVTCGELENFEDKNGSGTYKASYGHDDIIMTCVQIPQLQQTIKYKNFIEDILLHIKMESINNKWDQTYYPPEYTEFPMTTYSEFDTYDNSYWNDN